MKHRRTIVGSALLLTILAVAGVTLDLLCQELASAEPQNRQNRREPAKQTATSQTPEVVLELVRTNPAEKEPVDLDKFGDITNRVYHGQPDPNLVLSAARKAGKASGELEAIAQEWNRKAREHDDKEFREQRQLAENNGKSDEQLKKELENRLAFLVEGVATARWMRAQRADFRIAGVVVDDQGKPLSDVDVDVSKSWGYMFGWGCEWNERFAGNVRVSRVFNLRVGDARDVSLVFHKPGYHIARQSFRAPEPPNLLAPEILANKKTPLAFVEKRDLRVVLDKQGTLTQLTRCCGGVGYSAGGAAELMELDWREAASAQSMRDVYVKDVTVADVRRVESLPEHCVYVVPKTNSNGRIALTVAYTAPRPQSAHAGELPSESQRRVYAPVELRLVVTDPKGGFIPYEPKPGREYRDMKEAPRDGYQREFVLDSNAVKKLFANTIQANPFFFYFKAYGKYGKGQLGSLVTLDDGSRCSGTIVLLMQRDGSRHLEWLEDY